MRVLEVSSMDDYAAVTFEDELNEDVAKFVKLCDENNGSYEDEETGIEFSVHEFGDVDPKFIDWVKNDVIDYDDSKHHNFYVAT